MAGLIRLHLIYQTKAMRLSYMKSTIAIYLEDHPNFTTFSSLVKYSTLYQELHQIKGITVIALPNSAFEEMGSSTFTQLLNKERHTVKGIIAHHIIANKYRAKDLIHGSRIKMMTGGEVSIYNKDGILKLNNSLVTKPDIFLENGVLHIIDSLLM